MIQVRTCTQADIPAQRELWQLAFGDAGAYVDNFYRICWTPDRFLILEEDGHLCSMTAWFDTRLVLPGGSSLRAAYLYAVATRPECRGRGFASMLLNAADSWFRERSFPLVTTVPAEPSLHSFFTAAGFREHFAMEETVLEAGSFPPPSAALIPVTADGYGTLREQLLEHVPHIAYDSRGILFQEACCSLGKGGMYRADTSAGPALLCGEDAGDGSFVIKELLGRPEAVLAAAGSIPAAFPGRRWTLRGPRLPFDASLKLFGMVKVLDPELARRFDWTRAAWLGLAFD